MQQLQQSLAQCEQSKNLWRDSALNQNANAVKVGQWNKQLEQEKAALQRQLAQAEGREMLARENLGRLRKQLEQVQGRERNAVERLEQYKRRMREMGEEG